MNEMSLGYLLDEDAPPQRPGMPRPSEGRCTHLTR
jgi:hypothetical protein